MNEILNSKRKKELRKYGWTYKEIQEIADMIIYLQNFQNQQKMRTKFKVFTLEERNVITEAWLGMNGINKNERNS